MKTVHIYVSDEMYERLQFFIKTEGFKGPSEFFRFMINYFEYLPPTPKRTMLDRFRFQGNHPYEPTMRPPHFDFYPQRVPGGSDGGSSYVPTQAPDSPTGNSTKDEGIS